MFTKLYESLYLKAFVTIIIKKTTTTVYIEMLNKSGLVNSYEELFETSSLSKEMHNFILAYIKETPYYYVSILDNSLSQGAIPTCSKHQRDYYYDLGASEHKCYEKIWTYYTAKTDVYTLEKTYEKVGLDFVFSPFVLLANFFQDKISQDFSMFILVEETSLSVSVFDKSKLLYAEHLDTSLEDEVDELIVDEEIIEEVEEEEEHLDLDELNSIDEIDELDDFGDIEDLDSIDEIDEFDESKDVQEDLADNALQEELVAQDVSGLNEDYQRFSFVQSSINNFYNDEKFDSEFIQNVYIADGVGVSSDLKKFFEEEMFLSVFIRHIDLASEVCEMAKMELS